MTPDSLGQTLSGFLDGVGAAVVIEDGAIAFHLAESKYSISGEYNKCLLHLRSHGRNVVRRVLAGHERPGVARRKAPAGAALHAGACVPSSGSSDAWRSGHDSRGTTRGDRTEGR
ncbi:MAG TPA: hypothetical protein VIH78_07660 [Terriglobales bacterium]